MYSKPWQKQQSTVLYLGLALLVGVTRVSLDSSLDPWQKLALLVGTYLLVVPTLRYFHHQYANTFVKLFLTEYDVVARAVQRLLNAERIPFTKRTGHEQVDFLLRQGDLRLVVEFFPLNLPVDDQLKPIMASKITMSPVTAGNSQLAVVLQQRLDERLSQRPFIT